MIVTNVFIFPSQIIFHFIIHLMVSDRNYHSHVTVMSQAALAANFPVPMLTNTGLTKKFIWGFPYHEKIWMSNSVLWFFQDWVWKSVSMCFSSPVTDTLLFWRFLILVYSLHLDSLALYLPKCFRIIYQSVTLLLVRISR